MFKYVVLIVHKPGAIIAANTNCPGSWHDSRVAKPIYRKLLDPDQTPPGYYLVADTAFPRGANMDNKIHAPMKAGQRLPADQGARDCLLAFDSELVGYRQTAEWGMRALQGSFGRLRIPLEVEHQDRRGDLLETCIRLHNIRTNIVGINEIRSVYEPLWMSEDQLVWEEFGTMDFEEQRRHDRVSGFHNTSSL